MTEKWINLRTFDTTTDAFLARSLLQEHEIETMIENQHMANMYNPAVGGATLMVEAQNAQKALEILGV